MKPVKNTNTKKNPFTSAPAPAKNVTKPVIETKSAKAPAPVATPQVVAKPVVAAKPAAPIAKPQAVSAPAAAPVVAKTSASAPVAKPQSAPAAKPVVAEAKPITKASRSATIEAKIDVGFGNTLYLRGEGKGLNWNQGIPLTNVDGCTWQWSGEADEKLKVKLLLNDAVWAKGEDLVVAPGEKVQIAPAF